MDVRNLRYFVAVAETGSFSAAARRCRIAQPSLSQQVQKLEAEIGKPLFDRLGRTIALTEAGARLLPRARRILDEMREASRELVEGSETGTLAVGAIPTLAPYLLPAAIERFSASCPDAVLALSEQLTEGLLEGLLSAELDLALLSTPVEHEAIEVEVLGRDPFLLAVPHGHPLAQRESVGLAELAGQQAVLLDEMHCLGQQVEDLCRALRLQLRASCRAMQLATLLEMVARGVGVAMVPLMAARADHQGLCHYLPIEGGTAYREIAVATRKGRSRSSLAERFLASLPREGGASWAAAALPRRGLTPRERVQ